MDRLEEEKSAAVQKALGQFVELQRRLPTSGWGAAEYEVLAGIFRVVYSQGALDSLLELKRKEVAAG